MDSSKAVLPLLFSPMTTVQADGQNANGFLPKILLFRTSEPPKLRTFWILMAQSKLNPHGHNHIFVQLITHLRDERWAIGLTHLKFDVAL